MNLSNVFFFFVSKEILLGHIALPLLSTVSRQWYLTKWLEVFLNCTPSINLAAVMTHLSTLVIHCTQPWVTKNDASRNLLQHYEPFLNAKVSNPRSTVSLENVFLVNPRYSKLSPSLSRKDYPNSFTDPIFMHFSKSYDTVHYNRLPFERQHLKIHPASTRDRP